MVIIGDFLKKHKKHITIKHFYNDKKLLQQQQQQNLIVALQMNLNNLNIPKI